MNTLRTVTFLALLVTLVAPQAASAQSGTLNRFRPSETTEDDFHLSRPGDFGHVRLSAQLHVDYGLNPLVWESMRGSSDSEAFSLVEHQLTGTLGLGFGLFDRLVIYAGLPITLVMDGETGAEAMMTGVPLADGAGLGDAYLGARVRLFGDDDDVGTLGAQVTATFPTSIDGNYRGEPFLTAHPELLGELRPVDGLRIVLNVGALLREETSATTNLQFRHELTYGLGLGYAVWRDEAAPRTHLDLTAQIYGASAFALFGERDGTALEATAGAKFFHESGVVAGLAAGPGLARGFGSPDLRVIATVGWAMPEPEDAVDGDRDGDGIRDSVDECDDQPEDVDGFQDEDGCPDADNDGDGILDEADQCPMEPETVNQVDDADGCPDEVGDRDGDGIDDTADQCPDDPEDADGHEDEDGCPDPDNDDDGVLDGVDECVNEPGVVENRGCPDTDRDGDTVVDRRDNCPDEPGTVENQGCAERQQVVIEEGRLEILDHVYFRTNRAAIQRRSYALLLNVARVINAHPEITMIHVEGHTDSRGRRERNMELSQQRAEAVVEFLVERGDVDPSRLEAHGYGPDRPVVENASSRAEHAQNRRVEFNIPGSDIERRDSGPGADTIDR
ncbi:MAG: OmpA family protein [Myxococcota bacterium]|nr:OmpA family protein [Myxococcota bacterium]